MSSNKGGLHHWLRIGAEYIAVVLLFAHLLPEHFVEKWKENGLAAIILLGISLILALIFRFRSEQKLNEEIDEEEKKLSLTEQEYKDKLLILEATNKDLERLAVYAKIFPIMNQAFSQLYFTQVKIVQCCF